jgi:hypothetical protein
MVRNYKPKTNQSEEKHVVVGLQQRNNPSEEGSCLDKEAVFFIYLFIYLFFEKNHFFRFKKQKRTLWIKLEDSCFNSNHNYLACSKKYIYNKTFGLIVRE